MNCFSDLTVESLHTVVRLCTIQINNAEVAGSFPNLCKSTYLTLLKHFVFWLRLQKGLGEESKPKTEHYFNQYMYNFLRIFEVCIV